MYPMALPTQGARTGMPPEVQEEPDGDEQMMMGGAGGGNGSPLAALALAGNDPMANPQMAPGAMIAAGQMGSLGPGGQPTGAGPGQDQFGMSPSMGMGPDASLMAAQQKFQSLTEELDMFKQEYPMATELLQQAQSLIVQALLQVGQAIQQPPIQPGIPI